MGAVVKEIFGEKELAMLGLKCVAGEAGLGKDLNSPKIQKPGLLLTGLLDELHTDRIQILGAAEIGYLNSLEGEKLERTLAVIDKPAIPAIIITKGIEPPGDLLKLCDQTVIPLFVTSLTTSDLIEGLTQHLAERLAPSVTIHGVLVDVLGIGILMHGKSGIGKSECALDLVSRGYRLVADDVVIVRRLPPDILFGTSAGLTRYHMEIRGLGIVNIQDLFGITAIREKKQMDLMVELVKWEHFGEYERLGFEDKTSEILGVNLPYLKVPVSPGRSVASIVEVAARNQILKIMGKYSARELEAELSEAISNPDKVKV
ncbi:MAG: HPr(Ser) kinase/phosphatase [Thermodesulfobacteriota bacterium]|nr:MAG: HPr(Ser) kinase/phosphatase [Thermodesulfobacteriota bacterium]